MGSIPELGLCVCSSVQPLHHAELWTVAQPHAADCIVEVHARHGLCLPIAPLWFLLGLSLEEGRNTSLTHLSSDAC